MLKYFSDKNKYVVDEPSLWTINGSVDILYAGGTKHESGKLTVQVGNIESYVPIEKDTISPYIPPTNSDDENNNGDNNTPSGENVISINLSIKNETGIDVSLDGDLYFILANPDNNGKYAYDGKYTGDYIKTSHIVFSNSLVVFTSGETKEFYNIIWNDEGEGLKDKSPINPNLLPSAYHHNVAVYVGGNGEIVFCDNIDPTTIFKENTTYSIILQSVASGADPNPEPGGNEPGTGEEPGDTPINPGTSDGNPVININVNITNATNSPVQLDGRLRFVLGNPNQDGSWFAGWSGGPYIRTDNIWFSNNAITLGAGETRTFSGLTWQDADSGCGLGNASPLSSAYLPVYADDGSIAYAGNALMYTGGRSDTTLCKNLSPSIIFTNGETYNLTITSHL